MSHREAAVIFAIYEPRNCCHSLPWNDLGNEYNAPAIFGAFPTANIKPQIYFLKIRMKRDGNSAEQPRAAKTKSYEADVGLTHEGIHNCAARDVLAQQERINLIIQHDEIPPFG